MNTHPRLAALAAVLALLTPALRADPLIPYQGRVVVAGTNYDGTGRFKFALVDKTRELVQATANAAVSGGAVTGITVTNSGHGYTSPPNVTISGGGGSGATATASEADGQLSITLTTGGSGYTSAPTVTVPSPPPQVPVTYWSNDGTSVNGSQPTGAVPLTVTKGLFAVHLGRGDEMAGIPVTAINAAAEQDGAYLRVWFSDGVNGFQLLTPDQFIAPAVYLARDIRLNGDTRLGGSLQSEGGNARGQSAMDFQLQRNLPSQVASGDFSFIGGGHSNTASGERAVVGGGVGNTASGDQATVPGGSFNIASGAYSFAAGSNASALHNFTFVFGQLASTGQDQFLISGFVGMGTNVLDPTCRLTVNGNAKIDGGLNATGGLTTTAILGTQGVFSGNIVAANANFSGNVNAATFNGQSDRNAKERFTAVNGREILKRLADVPIEAWSYKQDTATRHIGPMAQDFYAAFAVGLDDKHIATVDADGVALAAIQGLNQLLDEKEAALSALRSDMQEMQSQIAALQQALKAGDARTKSRFAKARKSAPRPTQPQEP